MHRSICSHAIHIFFIAYWSCVFHIYTVTGLESQPSGAVSDGEAHSPPPLASLGPRVSMSEFAFHCLDLSLTWNVHFSSSYYSTRHCKPRLAFGWGLIMSYQDQGVPCWCLPQKAVVCRQHAHCLFYRVAFLTPCISCLVSQAVLSWNRPHPEPSAVTT